ncbi:MAG: hypothetical protein ACE366_23465 [Bradymonadia bacterium]
MAWGTPQDTETATAEPSSEDASATDPAQASQGDDAQLGAWHLTTELVNDVPVQIGLRATLTTPNRIRFGTSIGYMPGAYVDLINNTAEALDWYGEPTALLIETIISDSLISRTHVGWQPWADKGFYFEAGYAFVGVSSGGTVTAQELATAAEIETPNIGNSDRGFEASATLHMVDLEVGWMWSAWDALWLRAALGGAFTVSSSATVERNFSSGPAQAWDTFEQASEDYLVDIFGSYGHTVVLSMAVGYQVF